MRFKGVIKIVISLLLVTLVLQWVDLPQLYKTLRSISPITVFVVMVGYALGQALSAYKWWLISRSSGLESTYTTALRSYFIGMFVNCFGLGLVGGDLTRAIMLDDGQKKKATALATVLADRVQGLAVLAMLGTACAALFGRGKVDPLFIYLLIAITIAIALGWIFGPWLLLRFIPKEHRLYDKIEQICGAFPRNPRTLIAITGLSLAFHGLQVGLHWVMGNGLGAPIPLIFLFATIPFINILVSLPVSWNGLGVREASYMFFLVPGAISEEQAIAFGAIWLLAATTSAAIGGIIAFLTKDFSMLTLNKGLTANGGKA